MGMAVVGNSTDRVVFSAGDRVTTTPPIPWQPRTGTVLDVTWGYVLDAWVSVVPDGGGEPFCCRGEHLEMLADNPLVVMASKENREEANV